MADTSLVRAGDRWVCLGDSITAVGVYPRILQRVFAHCHPGVEFTVINSGVGGDTASDDPAKLEDRVLRHRPSVVSIMYGMNETINGWRDGRPVEPVLDAYRRNLGWLARSLRARGIAVVLMTPTLTDASCRSYFTLEKTVPVLRRMAGIVREVAAAEGALVVPVQEAVEAFQERQPGGVSLSIDGVHPGALGQYAIAHALWTHAGFPLPLGGPRRLAAPEPAVPEPAVPVAPALADRFLRDGDAGLDLVLTAAAPIEVEAVVTIGGERRQETLRLAAGANRWPVALPAALRPERNGQSADLLVELRHGAARSLHIVDLCRTEVLRLDGRCGGTIAAEGGRHVATWSARRWNDGLLIEAEVATRGIQGADEVWPFARDGLNIMLDYRPTARFADIGIDREVTQLFVNVREQPFLAAGVRAWSGHGMDLAATAQVERTPGGYRVQVLIHHNFDLHTPSLLSGRDFVGILVAVAEHDTGGLAITADQRNDQVVNAYANNLKIIDLQGRLPGDHVVNVHLASC